MSTITLFTTWTKEFKTQLDLVIGNQDIPTVTRPKILGVTFDNMLTFCTHGKSVQNKIQARTNILKSLPGSSWGKDKETLTITYKAIGRSIANYAALIWSPQLSISSWNDIQRAQNAALRTITRCPFMSNQDHLHREINIIPIKDYNDMLSKQYTLTCHLPYHPSYSLVNQGPPERNLRKYAAREYKEN